jgi:uncharacterized protein (DUF433 family)
MGSPNETAWYNCTMSTVSYPHIEQRHNGTLYIAGTPFKVRQIALDHVAYGWGPTEIQREHPQLTLGQIHAALGYYYDHKEALDCQIEEALSHAERLRAVQGVSSLAAKAAAAGKELP